MATDDTPDPAVEPDEPGPCQCIRAAEFITPIHDGHCCFRPADSGCHPRAVEAWWDAHRRRTAPPG